MRWEYPPCLLPHPYPPSGGNMTGSKYVFDFSPVADLVGDIISSSTPWCRHRTVCGHWLCIPHCGTQDTTDSVCFIWECYWHWNLQELGYLLKCKYEQMSVVTHIASPWINPVCFKGGLGLPPQDLPPGFSPGLQPYLPKTRWKNLPDLAFPYLFSPSFTNFPSKGFPHFFFWSSIHAIYKSKAPFPTLCVTQRSHICHF